MILDVLLDYKGGSMISNEGSINSSFQRQRTAGQTKSKLSMREAVSIEGSEYSYSKQIVTLSVKDELDYEVTLLHTNSRMSPKPETLRSSTMSQEDSNQK